MLELPPIPAGTTVFTHELAGADLGKLLEAAAENVWPNSQCVAEWVLLRNWAIQTESLMLDEAENLEWVASMRELAQRELPYAQWVELRLAALDKRTRARKLAQGRLRDKYGYKRHRRWGLVARDVRRFHAVWASND